MPITSLKFRPGINKETTSYSNKGGWNDCDLVRFRFGFPEKLGGWEKYSPSTFLGTSRTLHAWANLEGNKYLGLGTEIKFYIEESETFFDITPIRRKVVSGEVEKVKVNDKEEVSNQKYYYQLLVLNQILKT